MGGGMNEHKQYEFAELSFQLNAAICTLVKLPTARDREYHETTFNQRWSDVLSTLGSEGWAVASTIQYPILTALLLQREVVNESR